VLNAGCDKTRRDRTSVAEESQATTQLNKNQISETNHDADRTMYSIKPNRNGFGFHDNCEFVLALLCSFR